jgi:VWFA-related protein
VEVPVRHSAKLGWIIVPLIILLFAGDGHTQQAGQSGGIGGGMGQGQSQSRDQAPDRKPTQHAIRVTSKMVQLSVIVHDKDGNPVAGLRKEDFKLYDEGQEQKIAFFSEQSNILRAQNATTADQPIAQHSFSNHYTEDGSFSGSVTVILLDKLNTWAWDMNRSLHPGLMMNDMPVTMREVMKFLRHVQPQDRVALFGLSDKLYGLRDFTNDPDLLLTAVGAEPENGASAANGWMDALGPNQQVLDPDYRMGKTVAAFRDLSKKLSGIPGRKNLVWVTAGLESRAAGGQVGNRSFMPQIATAIRALADANIAVYPVDARGLVGPNLASISGSMAPRRAEFDTMLDFAEGTGGRALYNTNDIAGSIRKSIDDARVSYLLGYYPSNDKWEGDFRELKVKVNRSGMDVRARKGYYAIPDSSATTEQASAQLDEAIRSSLDSSELKLEVSVEPVNVADPRQLKVQTKLDPTQLHMEEHSGAWTDKLDVAWAEYDSNGVSLGTVTQSISVKLSQECRKSIAREGIIFTETVDVQRGAVEARLAVRDAGSGAIGSVNIPLTRLFAGAVKP